MYRNGKKQIERGFNRNAEGKAHVVWSRTAQASVIHWCAVWRGGGDSVTQTFCIGLHVWEKVENGCSAWPLPWAKAKQTHLSWRFPSTSFNQAPWWHQPCFRNYLTSVFQITNEPARVTNIHISSGKLSTYQTGCWPSGTSYSFKSGFILYLRKEHAKKTTMVLLARDCRHRFVPHGNGNSLERGLQIQQRHLLFLTLCVLPPSFSLSSHLLPTAHPKQAKENMDPLLLDICNKHTRYSRCKPRGRHYNSLSQPLISLT